MVEPKQKLDRFLMFSEILFGTGKTDIWRAVSTAFMTLKDEGESPLFPPKDKAEIMAVACGIPADYGLEGQTHWSISTLQSALLRLKYFPKISWSFIQKTLHKAEIKPHRMKYYLFCKDPALPKKARKICSLYLRPPKNRLLLCLDERSGTQALERTDSRSMTEGRIFKQDFGYVRHGTVDLFAVREVKTGIVFARTYSRHTQDEFLDFMKRVRRQFPRKKLTIVLDNLRVHQTARVLKWLQGQKGMVEFVFTPKHASWLNQIELWFRELFQKCLKRLSVFSVKELCKKMMTWIKTYNRHFAHPYNWKSNGFLTTA